ncbi:MAG: hypothetical protein IPI55_13090 [Flavobacteriales bacterium]|nr:hypothetical protein [Flavobacteriales bacterium]
MRRTITALALLFFVPFVSYAQQENSTAPPAVEPIVPAVIDLSPAEVAAMLGQPNVFI